MPGVYVCISQQACFRLSRAAAQANYLLQQLRSTATREEARRREARGGLRAAREGGAAAVLDSRAGSDDVDVDVDGHTTG